MNEHLGDLLSALLDGELTEPAVDQARAHLAACPICAEEMTRVGEARSWVRALPPVEPPASYFERLAAVRQDELFARRRRIGVVALAGSAAAGLAFLGVVAPQEPATTPPVPRLVEAHATAAGTGDPLTQLVSAGVPLSLRR